MGRLCLCRLVGSMCFRYKEGGEEMVSMMTIDDNWVWRTEEGYDVDAFAAFWTLGIEGSNT